jgi:ABC-type sulfate transport system permease component
MSFLSRRATPAHTSWYADQSANSLPVNRIGGVVQNDESSGIRSASFDGSTGYLTTTTGNFQSGNSTIEFWMKPTQYLEQPILHCASSLHIHMMTGGALHVNNGISPDVIMPVQLNVWQHVAVVIDGSSKRVFLNGILKHTTTQLWGSNSNPLYIGKNTTLSRFYNGLLVGLRIIKGTALYTTNFALPVFLPTAVTGTTLLMNFGATTAPTWFADSSTAFNSVSSSGGGMTIADEGFGVKVASFSNSYLQLSSTPDISTGDYTIETFINFSTNSIGYQPIFTRYNIGADARASILIYLEATNRLQVNMTSNGSSWTNFISDTLFIPNTNVWYHIAFCVASNIGRVFINGIQAGSSKAWATAYNTNQTWHIGRYANFPGGPRNFTGRMAGVRITKSALYTTNFNIPTTLPTALGGTELLMNFGATSEPLMWLNTSTTQSTYLSSVAQAGIVTQIATGNVVSAYTNKQGHLLTNLGTSFSTGDFDISFFIKFDDAEAQANEEHIVWQPSGGLAIYRASDETIRLNWVGIGDRLISSIRIIDTNWHYIQLKRASSISTFYIDGVFAGNTNDTTSYSTSNFYVIPYSQSRPIAAQIAGLRVSRSGTLSTTVPTSAAIQSDDTTILLMNFGSTGVPSLWYGDASSNRYATSIFADTSLSDEGNGVKAAAFDGTGDYLSTTVPGDFPGNFTIEFFAKNNTNATTWYIGNTKDSAANNNGWAIGVLAGNLIRLSSYTSGYNTPAFTGSITNWNHIAICKSGTTVLIFVNGILISSSTPGFPFSNTDPILIGNLGGSLFPNGKITNVRIVKGTALYTSNFVVPTTVLTDVPGTVLLLPFQSTAVPQLWYRDTSSVLDVVELFGTPIQYDFGNRVNAAMFDGNSSRITAYSTNGFTFGTGNWTVEFFVQLLAIPTTADYDCFVTTADPADAKGIYIGISNTRQIPVLASNAGGTNWTFSQVPTPTIDLGKWYHVAVVVNTGILTTYFNGSAVASSSITVDIPGINGGMQIGGRTKSSQYSTSRIAGLRVVKGTAVYTSNFDTPTTLPTNIAGTELLLNFDSEVWAGLTNTSDRYRANTSLLVKFNGTNGSTTFVDSSPNAYTLTNNGTGAISTAQFKYGTGSYLGGTTGSYFTVGSDNTPFAFGTGDFAIEFWYRTSSTASLQNIVVSPAAAIFQSSSTIRYQTSNVTRIISTTIVANTWYHVAVSRVSGITRMFINGALQTTTYADATNYLSTGAQWEFGGNTGPIVGNMDELCITKGVGKYITFFIPQENYTY